MTFCMVFRRSSWSVFLWSLHSFSLGGGVQPNFVKDQQLPGLTNRYVWTSAKSQHCVHAQSAFRVTTLGGRALLLFLCLSLKKCKTYSVYRINTEL